jgi:glycosyltransferase involved in cell wall biosynthesis
MPASELQKTRAHIRSIAANADGVFGVSEALCEKLERECGIRATPLANGADLAGLRSVPPERVRELRRRLGLESRFVIGYVGNHGAFTGVDLVVKAYLAVRSRFPDAALLIVGPADPWRSILDAHRSDGVISTGGVSPAEVGVYFNALDVGVLAQSKSTGTDYAFQIKVVEYSACRKCVVSTPLCTWQRLAWPNVFLAEADPLVWADAFVRARSIRWQSAWDRVVEPYDWSALADKVAAVMLAEPVA